MECKFCGRELEDDAVYCFYCGKRLDGKKPCPSCKALLPEDAIFCGKCGARVVPEVREQLEEDVTEEVEEVTETEEEPEVIEEHEQTEEVEESEGGEQPEKAPEEEHHEGLVHNAKWKKAVEITKLCLAGFAALVGFIFTFCIGVSVNGTGQTRILFFDFDGQTNLSIFDYFGRVYENLDITIVNAGLGNTQSFALYMPYLFGTLITVGALICNFVFMIITVIAVVRQYAYKNAKANFIKPALRTFISFAIFAAAFYALNAASSHTLDGENVNVYFNDVTLAALIIGGVAFGGYFACNTVLRLKDFTDKKEIIKSSVALGTGVVGIITAILLTLTVCRFSVKDGSYSLGLMPMIGHSALDVSDSTNCGGVMCFGIPAFLVQITLLVLTVCVIIATSVRVGSGSGKMPLGVAIAAAVLTVLYFLGTFATANMLNAEIANEASISRSYAVPITVIVLGFIMLGGVIATIVLEKKFKRTA